MTLDSYICPNCGSEVKVGANCPGCVAVPKQRRRRVGSTPRQRVRRGWRQDAAYDGVDLPDGEFDYDEFIAREFSAPAHRKLGLKWYWWATALGLLGFFGWAVLSGLF